MNTQELNQQPQPEICPKNVLGAIKSLEAVIEANPNGFEVKAISRQLEVLHSLYLNTFGSEVNEIPVG